MASSSSPTQYRLEPFTFANLHPNAYARLVMLHKWFTEERIETILMPLIEEKFTVSLRLLEWLVTNYSKKHNIVIWNKRKRTVFNINADYKNMLDHWNRDLFDPFRRHPRDCPQTVFFDYQGTLQQTTVGQLNFLYWASVNGIIRYALKYKGVIEQDMKEANQRSKKRKKTGQKRVQLSERPASVCRVYRVDTDVLF